MNEYLMRIFTSDVEVAAAIRDGHARELNAARAALDDVLRGLFAFGSERGKPTDDLESARLFLATRGFNSLYSAVMMLECGYFQQAFTLVRMAKEDQLVARDAEHNRSTLDALLHGKGRIGSGDLTFAKMAERMSPKAKQAWDDNYGFLSEYGVHTRLKGLRSLVAIGSDGRPFLQPGGQYDKILVSASLYHILSQMIQLIATVAQLTASAEIDWIDSAIPTLDEVEALVNRLHEWAGD